MTKADYAARIPPCCSYRTLDSHINGLGLCWSLVTATEQKAPMDCSRCDLVIPGVRTLNWIIAADTEVELRTFLEGKKIAEGLKAHVKSVSQPHSNSKSTKDR